MTLRATSTCERGEPLEVLALRRTQHERVPSASTYRVLRTAADALNAWPVEQDAARARLERRNPRDFVVALLADGDSELAWSVATSAPPEAIDRDLWLRLAEHREPTHPADALAVYQRVADEVLEQADRRAYRSAAQILQRARTAAQAAGDADAFAEYLTRLREQYRRRPSLIEILNKAGLRP